MNLSVKKFLRQDLMCLKVNTNLCLQQLLPCSFLVNKAQISFSFLGATLSFSVAWASLQLQRMDLTISLPMTILGKGV